MGRYDALNAAFKDSAKPATSLVQPNTIISVGVAACTHKLSLKALAQEILTLAPTPTDMLLINLNHSLFATPLIKSEMKYN